MTDNIKSFEDSYAIGKKHENTLDKYYSNFYHIEQSNRVLERLGIDRIFIHKSNEMRYSVEYKSDERTKDTGNVFIETWSVDNRHIRGWVYMSIAQFVYYYVPSKKEVSIVRTMVLRNNLYEWYKLYDVKQSPNRDYNGNGITVPYKVFKSIADKVDVLGTIDMFGELNKHR